MPQFNQQTIPGNASNQHEVNISSTVGKPVNPGTVEGDTVVVTLDGTAATETLETWVWDEGIGDWLLQSSAETVTTIDPINVDTSDPLNPVVTIVYNNEDGSQVPRDFTFNIPNPVSVVNSIDLKPTSNPNELTVEIVYTDDDGNTQTIVDTTPVLVSSPCPEPMTRSALLALVNTGDLDPSCHYTITDYNRGTVGAAEITMTPASDDALSMDAEVLTVFDNVAWKGRYDINTNRLEYLADNIGNEVTGRASVDNFPWGQAGVAENRVINGSLTINGGTATGNTVESDALVTVDGGNFIDNKVMPKANVVSNANTQRNVFASESNVTITAGDFLENDIGSDSIVAMSSTGDFDQNVISSASNVNVSGTANFDNNNVSNSANIVVNGGEFTNNDVASDATVTVDLGNVYSNEFGQSSNTRFLNSRQYYRNVFSRTNVAVFGDHNVHENEFSFSNINTTGSTGSGIRYSKFLDSRGNTTMQNITTLDIAYITVSNNSSISANGALRLYLRYVTLENYGRLLLSAGTRLDSQYTGCRDYSYIQVLNGVLFANYCSVKNVSYIQQNTPNTNRLDSTNISARSRVRFLGTSSNCRVYYTDISSGSFVEHRGSSNACYFYYCSVDSSSQMYSNNSVNLRAYYNKASGNSIMYSQNVTGTHYMYYNALNGHGYIWFTDSTGGRIYAVSCHGQGLLRFRGATPAGRIYYSSFTAYYYLYAENWTVTRTALHGYGRRTYTVTNPPNGTFSQNF